MTWNRAFIVVINPYTAGTQKEAFGKPLARVIAWGQCHEYRKKTAGYAAENSKGKFKPMKINWNPQGQRETCVGILLSPNLAVQVSAEGDGDLPIGAWPRVWRPWRKSTCWASQLVDQRGCAWMTTPLCSMGILRAQCLLVPFCIHIFHTFSDPVCTIKRILGNVAKLT